MFRGIATTPVVPEFAGIFRRLCGTRANSGSGGKFPNYAANVLPGLDNIRYNDYMHAPSESGGQIR
jgi:hypothetical protein